MRKTNKKSRGDTGGAADRVSGLATEGKTGRADKSRQRGRGARAEGSGVATATTTIVAPLPKPIPGKPGRPRRAEWPNGSVEPRPRLAPSDEGLATLIAELDHFGRRRQHAIRTCNKINNSTEALLRRELGWDINGDDASREKARKAAAKARIAIEKGENPPRLSPDVPGFVLKIAKSRLPLDEMRFNAETAMVVIAKKLPAYSFVKEVSGLGDLTFAILVGLSGDLSHYPEEGQPLRMGPKKLAKRLCLAPFTKDGVTRSGAGWRAANKQPGHLTAGEDGEWARFAYKGSRYAEMHVIGENLIRAQVRRPKDDAGNPTGEPAYAIGPYGEIYLSAKVRLAPKIEFTAHRPKTDRDKWTPLRVDLTARKVMLTRLVGDLWWAWRRETRLRLVERPKHDLSPAVISQAAE